MPISWTLTPLVVTPPGVITAGTPYAFGSPIDIGVPYYHPQSEFLEIAAAVLPDWYLEPLENNGQGYELFEAYASLFEAASLAVGQLQVLATLQYSSGGQNALAAVQFYRPSLMSGAFTVKAGTIVSTSATNRQYQTLADISFGVDDIMVATLVSSLGQDSDYNVTGPIVTAAGTLLEGEIDTIVIPNLDPPFAEPNLAVWQIADAYGGTAPALDQLGDDRGITRASNESDANYKQRALALPNTITPDALQFHLDAVFYPRMLHYDLIETWENRYQSCWNAPIGGPSDPIFGTLVAFAYNDPRTDRFIPRWMGENDHRGAFVVVVPTFPTIADRGMAYNDPATTATTTRGTSVWNDPSPGSPTDFPGVWNGEDDAGEASRAQFLSSTYNLLASIKGGGISVAFIPAEVDESLPGAPYP